MKISEKLISFTCIMKISEDLIYNENSEDLIYNENSDDLIYK